MSNPESKLSSEQVPRSPIIIHVGSTPDSEGIYPAFSKYRLPIVLKGTTHYCEILGYNPTNGTLVVQLYDHDNKPLRSDEFPITTLQNHCPVKLKQSPNISVRTRAFMDRIEEAPAIALSIVLSLWALMNQPTPHQEHHETSPNAHKPTPQTMVELRRVTPPHEDKNTND